MSDYVRTPYTTDAGSIIDGGGFGVTNDEIRLALNRSAAILYLCVLERSGCTAFRSHSNINMLSHPVQLQVPGGGGPDARLAARPGVQSEHRCDRVTRTHKRTRTQDIR